jgi:hypothetical protein
MLDVIKPKQIGWFPLPSINQNEFRYKSRRKRIMLDFIPGCNMDWVLDENQKLMLSEMQSRLAYDVAMSCTTSHDEKLDIINQLRATKSFGECSDVYEKLLEKYSNPRPQPWPHFL